MVIPVSLTEPQEVWALRKMGYLKIGERREGESLGVPAGPWAIRIEPVIIPIALPGLRVELPAGR